MPHTAHHLGARVAARILAAILPALIAALALIVAVDTAHVAAQDEEGKAANVVVQYDETASIVRTIAFTSPISGLSALDLTGLDVITTATDFGPAVCAIQDVGCPADDCFCQCAGGDTCKYWGYFTWDGSEWASNDIGPGGTLITATGAVEGWLWGEFGAAMTPATNTLAAVNALHALQMDQQQAGIGSAANAVETMLAIGANQQRAQAWTAPDGSLLSALMAGVTRYMRAPSISPAAAGKAALAIAATDACWPLGARMPMDFYDAEIAAYSEFSGINAWAMLGTLALGEPVSVEAVATLKGNIQPDGGWEWMTGFGSDTNTTSVALQAMLAAGESITATEVISGLVYFAAAQNGDGGFSYDATAPDTRQSDANSTAYVIQALLAAGETVGGPDWQTKDGNTPYDYLLSNQLETGAFAWQTGGDANTLATQQAIPALLGQSYPFRYVYPSVAEVELCRGAYLPIAVPGVPAP